MTQKFHLASHAITIAIFHYIAYLARVYPCSLRANPPDPEDAVVSTGQRVQVPRVRVDALLVLEPLHPEGPRPDHRATKPERVSLQHPADAPGAPVHPGRGAHVRRIAWD